jgi:hypothetical protein
MERTGIEPVTSGLQSRVTSWLPTKRSGRHGFAWFRLRTDYRQHYRRGERIDISASAPRALRRALWLAFIDCRRCLSDGSNLVHDPRYPTRIASKYRVCFRTPAGDESCSRRGLG